MAVESRTVRRHLRIFVLAWLGITALIAMMTFLAVYATYKPEELDAGAGNALPLQSPAPILPSPDATASPIPSPSPSPAPPTTAPLPPTLLPIPSPSPLPLNDLRYQVGIQVDYSPDFNPVNQDNYYRSVRQDLGLTWVKQQVRWQLMESEPGDIDWSVLDFVMPSARRFGVKMLLSIVTAPDWAREADADLSQHGPPADPHSFADFAVAIVQRYAGTVHAIEVWNEQNINREWTSTQGLSAERYVELLRVTAEALRAVDPGIIIISGALSPTGLNDAIRATDDFVYLDQMIAAGMLEWADCVGAHHNGYNIGPSLRYDEVPNEPSAIFRGPFDNPHHSWSFRSTLEGYANRIRSRGYDTRLCVTEFGWSSAEDLGGTREGSEFALDNSLSEQAQWIPQALSNMRDWGFVWLAIIWNFNYGPQAGYAPQNDNVLYSLIGPGYTFRPAYDSIRTWQRQHIAEANA